MAGTETTTVERTQDITRLLPPYAVILHNDDHNSMDHVVRSLLKAVPQLTPERAAEVMLEAHNHGQAVVIVCPLEPAELYRDRIQTFGLTATIEPAN
jgi:ATP-dependent Clp protease adaptor protein ClpS